MEITQNIIQDYDKYVMNTYTRSPIVLVKGKGSKVWDAEGNEYLDFFPGWGVSGLGHAPVNVIKAVKEQAKKLIHVSNNYYNELAGKLAQKIIEHSFDGKVFFCNSGAEAVEGAIKLARAYGNPARYEIITMQNSFHGRTLAAITATAQEKYQKGFEPLVSGFIHVPFNDIEAVRKNLSDKTVAVMLELIQGEGGINVADKDYVADLRKLCDERNILLIFDEVQTGIGRTGEMFCFKHYGVLPDIMTLAKSLGGGVPIGAMVANRKIADTLKPGMHASTFGGGPLVCAAALATFETIEEKKLLSNVAGLGEYLFKKLSKLKKKYPIIKEIRGKGLMIGIELTKPGKPVVEKCIEKRLLINCTHEAVLRLLPALSATRKESKKALAILEEVLREASA
ncbi:MAG: aspartate aminotransferase family protein [Candidatus Omnitrophota bacterium]